MIIRVTDPSVVVLVGASGAGKSTFARKHFKPTEVLSSDVFRGLVSDDENSQSASAAAFDVLYYVAKKRLEAYKLVVIDATNTDAAQRAVALKLARELHVLATAIVLDLPVEVCRAHNAARPDRQFGDHVLRRHVGAIRRSLRTLRSEGFRQSYVLSSAEEVAAATVERQRLWNDKREEHGPFDIIGDVHGCYQELRALLAELGWTVSGTREQPEVVAPPGRRAIFLGDLVDRGPDSPGVLRLVMHMHAQGLALVIPGNHEVKLKKALDGAQVRPTHGLAETLAQLAAEPDVEALKARVSRWIDGLVSHYVLDDGRLVVAHAGLSEELQGRASARVREFALYGDTTGETDEFGLPVRYPWAREYRGRAAVVYGHTPVPEAEWLNGTLCLDTGCVFGGKLTALRWPEKVLVEVPAERTYYEPHRPLPTVGAAREAVALDINDVRGRRYVETRLGPPVAVRPENAAAALEVMARFTVDPRWLVYLPPTMSPPRAAPAGEPLLERPEEALAYYAEEGVAELVCEEKHMGSRAVVVLCRDESVAARRFGIAGHGRGVIYTRTGRPFFTDEALERELLARIDTAMEAAGLWTELGSDWVVLDLELLPWSAKAQALLRGQYAAVGASAQASLAAAEASLAQAVARLPAVPPIDRRSPETSSRLADAGALLARVQGRRAGVAEYVAAYRRYCWPVSSVDDLVLAPFHVLASEGHVHDDRDHLWHMAMAARLAEVMPKTFRATPHRSVVLADATSRAAAVEWWAELVARGGEGMVVKPRQYMVRGKHGWVQPAIKVRGPDYLRIIYGPEYRAPESLERLRGRALGHKRALAMRELALGLEGLHRLVAREGLPRVHECVFAVLALESEPVDPRL